MTDQLDGRDLDRACGEAMGWTNIQEGYYVGELFGLRQGSTAPFVLPLYSTDPGTQAEKLAWLQACDFRFVEITRWDDGTWAAKGFGSPDHHLDREDYGTTIDQALARLVVSVAKAKKEQGK